MIMRYLPLLSIILLSSCQTAGDFDFLLGEWSRINEQPGKQTFEKWAKQNDSAYIGHGYTLSGTDTVWQENTMLSLVEGVWHFQVKLKGETQSTDFKVIQTDGQSFTCENAANDFPKLISYRREGKELHAKISGGVRTVSFVFAPAK